jgi:hypothetical protein
VAAPYGVRNLQDGPIGGHGRDRGSWGSDKVNPARLLFQGHVRDHFQPLALPVRAYPSPGQLL